MAIDPVDLDDFHSVVTDARRRLVAAGHHKAPRIGRYDSPLGAEERTAIIQLLRDGTYGEAARRVGEEDPELADQ